jgi:hypothetical protein
LLTLSHVHPPIPTYPKFLPIGQNADICCRVMAPYRSVFQRSVKRILTKLSKGEAYNGQL